MVAQRAAEPLVRRNVRGDRGEKREGHQPRTHSSTSRDQASDRNRRGDRDAEATTADRKGSGGTITASATS